MLSKKEAFQMILDKIFDSSTDTINLQELIGEYTQDYLDQHSPKNVDTAEDTMEDIPVINVKPQVSESKTPSKSKSKSKPAGKPTERYEFPPTYKKTLNWGLFNNGTVGSKKFKQGQFESYQVLNVFEKCKLPFTNEELNSNVNIISANGFNLVTGMKLLYNIQCELGRGKGDLLDIIYDIYCNNYNVPPYSLFGVQNKQITVNNVETGIKPFQIKQWIDEINNSVDSKGSIVKIMRESKSVSKKYLFTLLKNYEDKSLLELLE